MNLSQLLTRGKDPVVLTYNRTFTNTAAPLRTPAGESSQSPQQPVPKASSNKKNLPIFFKTQPGGMSRGLNRAVHKLQSRRQFVPFSNM